MQIVSYVLSAITLLLITMPSFLKGKDVRAILLLVFFGNFIASVNYFITDAINGAVACFIGAIMTIINYFFKSKGNPIPKWLSAIYILIFTCVNLAAGGLSIPSLIVIVTGVMFVLSVGQENGKKYRFWTAINIALWVVYDVMLATWGPFTQHAIQLTATVVGIITLDIEKER